MLTIERAVQISFLALVLTSGLLLGLSQRNTQLTMIAAVGGIAGFIVSDWKRWFQLRGLFANIASVIVLIFAMKDFLGGDGASKLVSVSNLLVYLQTVLMFQEKTPRLNWQLLVLSLLQIVVAAIFNLNFEGGLLFVFYFIVAGITLILQSIYVNQCAIRNRNRVAAEALSRIETEPDRFALATQRSPARVSIHRPIAIFYSASDNLAGYRRVFQHLFLWLGVSLIFSTVLFYTIPRGEQAWFGPGFVKVSSTGKSMQVDLDEHGVIEPDAKLIMRVWFEKQVGSSIVEHRPNGPVYMRGMALGSLTIEDNKTTWKAPHDRVYPSVYRQLRATNDSKNSIRQRITLQSTPDPLLYAAMPVFKTRKTLSEIEYCFEISALSRLNGNDQIETIPYSYELDTLQTPDGRLLESWPYLVDHPAFANSPMHVNNPGQHRWLTELDRNRYPEVVKIADEIAAENSSNRIQKVRAMEQYFSRPNLFTYTLDFTQINFRDDCDPIEDFFGNHRSGHCELYASALTVMLRSQGIPARIVLGFYASEYDERMSCHMVRASQAHAWVEAYLRPQDCTPTMFNNKAAGPGGAWLRLDPTPASELGIIAPGNAMESVRTLWQDYVLGLDASNQKGFSFESSSSRLLGLFDLSNWNRAFQNSSETLANRPVVRAGILLLVLMAILTGIYRAYLRREKKSKKRNNESIAGGFRRLLGEALSYISPEWSKWVLGETDQQVSAEFYRHLTRILENAGSVRPPSQTHRQFAHDVISKWASRDQNGLIKKTITEITELFYRVRFGRTQLGRDQKLELKEQLNELERQLSLETRE